MVNDFTLFHVPRIVFGKGKLSILPGLVKIYGSNLLILTGKESFTKNDWQAVLLKALEQDGIHYWIDCIIHEPSPIMIDNLVNKYYGSSVQVIAAIGGGSVIDAGKAVSAMLQLNEPVKDYLEGVGTKNHPGSKVPFIAVPTTAGTGSETTGNAVLSQTGPDGFKRSLRHENFIPDIALVDPALTMSCSPGQTAISGMDAFTQLLESFLSVRSSCLTDALALEGIMQITKYLKTTVSEGNNPEARAGMSYAAMLSGITLANAGLGLVHGFASSIGGLKDIPHGVICGTMMGVVNRYLVERLLKANKQSIALEKYIRLGKMISRADGRSDVDYAFYVANYIESLVEELDIPSLGNYGLSDEDIMRIAGTTDHKNNPVIFTPEELEEMIRIRL
ncbi:MAG: iron-containing alcohol dehydrogenase [Bacteroidales bacterium]|nr:iron-containing alcohol dehydrogenase [Bacteroidales bacterium]